MERILQNIDFVGNVISIGSTVAVPGKLGVANAKHILRKGTVLEIRPVDNWWTDDIKVIQEGNEKASWKRGIDLVLI